MGTLHIRRMESASNYLEDPETKLAKEIAELFSKMREQRESMALKVIEDIYSIKPLEGVLYDIKPLEGVLYDPCVRIPMSLGQSPGHYYWNDFSLPKDEYVVFKHETTYQHQSGPTYKCIALTSHGRCFVTKQVVEIRDFSTNSFVQYDGTYSSDSHMTVFRLNPLPYRMPASILSALQIGMGLSGIDITSLHCPDTRCGLTAEVIKQLSDTTTSLHEINMDFHLFAGKWQPHMTEQANFDVHKMRQTIKELKEKHETLEQQNERLLAELKQLKAEKAALDKKKANLNCPF